MNPATSGFSADSPAVTATAAGSRGVPDGIPPPLSLERVGRIRGQDPVARSREHILMRELEEAEILHSLRVARLDAFELA